MNCLNCGVYINKTDSFCSNCGSEVNNKYTYCSKCGSKVEKSDIRRENIVILAITKIINVFGSISICNFSKQYKFF